MDRFDCKVEQRPGAPGTPGTPGFPGIPGAPGTPGVLVAHLSGSLGISGGAQFRTHANELIERKPRTLVLEMSGVDFIASPGIALLIELGQVVPSNGGRVAIAGATPLVAETLRRLRVNDVIPMHDRLEDALG